MKRPGILLLNLLIMIGYSVLFMVLGFLIPNDYAYAVIPFQWGVLAIHIVVLFIWSIVSFTRPEPEQKSAGGKLLLAALLVALIGHGLCFFNGLMHMGNIH